MEDTILIMDEKDNVGVALCPLTAGVAYRVIGRGTTIQALADIPFGHKVALTTIAVGSDIVKYGEVIATAAQAIDTGAWVHSHNMLDTM